MEMHTESKSNPKTGKRIRNVEVILRKTDSAGEIVVLDQVS
jgi:hypothetical protein